MPAPWWPAFLEGLQARVYREVPQGPRHAELLIEFLQLPGTPSAGPVAIEPITIDGAAGEFRVVKPGTYMFWVQVASEGEAGVWAQVDERVVIPLTRILPTRPRWIRLGRLSLPSGTHRLHIWTTQGKPTVSGVRLTYD